MLKVSPPAKRAELPLTKVPRKASCRESWVQSERIPFVKLDHLCLIGVRSAVQCRSDRVGELRGHRNRLGADKQQIARCSHRSVERCELGANATARVGQPSAPNEIGQLRSVFTTDARSRFGAGVKRPMRRTAVSKSPRPMQPLSQRTIASRHRWGDRRAAMVQETVTCWDRTLPVIAFSG
jgi:hypothetical protein